jgi:chromosome segregation ATPase
VQVTVLDRKPKSQDPEEVRRVFEKARGAWGTDKSLEEVEAEIQRLRDEWDRLDRG